MAESGSPIHPSKTHPQKVEENLMTPFSNFIYKAVFVCVLIALLPIFTSQSPELANKTIVTRSWELLHLLLVGIAISYGLFSRRNSDHDVDKEAQPKYDNTPQSYVSQVLQVSPVFDEEEAIESPRGPELPDETKSQTWNYSQYNPGEPVVMVAKESTEGSKVTTKPLFLPVRSLKSIEGGEDGGKAGAGAALPSPIPWRSRSGRMEAPSPSISAFEAELGPSRVPSFRSSTRHSASSTPSPRRLSPSPSMSSEIRAKTSEDSGRKKSIYKSSPPPAPPPPPLPLVHGHNIATEKKSGSKSFKYELEHLSMRGRGRGRFLHSDELGVDPSEADTDPYGGRSVRSREAQKLRTLPRNKSKKKNEFREKMIIESDSSNSDAGSETSDVGELPNSASAGAGAGAEENEVDKKADEFIAKFREQIRLQRIASIKRSTAQRNVRSQS